jgi:pantoate ligase / CMP/dCMP kinase
VLLFTTIRELNSYLVSYRNRSTIGLVPTMGALHEGHLSLIKRAIAQNDLVVVSIFVNPLQFAPTEDLAKYPRQLARDADLCQKVGVNAIFAPTAAELGIRGDNPSHNTTTTVIPPTTMTSVLCGKFRPGHFAGVATIVTKLFNIVRCDRAYFGQKDAQQLAIIRRLVADLNLPLKIVTCEIVRESSGLALSSRNQYLTAPESQIAASIYQSLQQAKIAFEDGETQVERLIDRVRQELNKQPEVKIQYIELVDLHTLEILETIETSGLMAIAAYVGSTRLIDNIVLKRQPIIAIDGPAGAGKSTVTRRVAHQLKLLYLDTGAMYRAVTWWVMQSNLKINDEDSIAKLISEVDIQLVSPDSADLPSIVYVNDTDVTQVIRTPEVTKLVSTISAQAAVRQKLVKMQQDFGAKGGIIAEGRDIGTNVFPDAELKIFLTASPAERARRRSGDLQSQGYQNIDLEQLAREIQQRDELDSNRVISPLKKADDAIELITDGISIDEVIQKIIDLYHDAVNVSPPINADKRGRSIEC